MATRPTYSHTPGTGRPPRTGRQELTQAFNPPTTTTTGKTALPSGTLSTAPPVQSGPIPDASPSQKGAVRLTGDLSGTADSPTLAQVGTAGPFGDASHFVAYVLDGSGRVVSSAVYPAPQTGTAYQTARMDPTGAFWVTADGFRSRLGNSGVTGTDALGGVFEDGLATVLSTPGGIAATVPVAPTGGLTVPGSMTFDSRGRLTVYVPPS